MCMAQATMLLWETMKEGRRTASRGHLTTVSLCLTPPMPMEKRSITLVCGWRDPAGESRLSSWTKDVIPVRKALPMRCRRT